MSPLRRNRRALRSGRLSPKSSPLPRGSIRPRFGGTKEQVRRGAETDRGVLLVDGVNLAAATARKDADAFVSRFMRISDAYGNRPVHMPPKGARAAIRRYSISHWPIPP